MAISFRKYVDIASGIGGRAILRTRDFIARLYTANPRCPAGGVLEFDYLEDVLAFFGGKSEEYKRAAFYFAWISKTQVRAKKISFALWPTVNAAPHLRGLVKLPTVESYAAITDGSFTLTIGDQAYEVEGCNFGPCIAYADVASVVETAIRAAHNDTACKVATVAYDADSGAFILASGKVEKTTIAPLAPASTGTFIGPLLGLDDAAAPVASEGATAQVMPELLAESIDKSNNFGSFAFIGQNLTLEEAKEAAVVADASNMQFMLCLGVTAENAKEWYNALHGYSGVALTLLHPEKSDEYPEMAPMVMLAATDYTRMNGTINYMFHQFNITPTVTTTPISNAFDALRVNYYGRTQQAGQVVDFYQRGVLCGNVQDMNIYANEMWLKDQAAVDILNLLLALPKISANNTGRVQIMGALQNVIRMALFNGAISVGKKLNYTQQAFILQVTGNPKAYREIETDGYWLDVQIEEMRLDDRLEYKAKYLLLYSKDDIIRKVEGTHTLM